MNLGINQEEPLVMHIDLNSAFAMTEQQAHPSLRGRPIGVTNRISKYCCVIAASYEAKALGIKVGMRLDEARALAPDFVILETDPPKYHYVYQKLMAIMKSYSPDIKMKSIDEGVIDFHSTREIINKKPLSEVGYEIKKRLQAELGSWMKVNVGIGPNRFLAKQAASWHKPDGLDIIDHRNLVDYYKGIALTDLSGIASHFEARLNAVGIFTALQFFEASSDILRRQVFHSVLGQDWHKRLRGHEVDDVDTRLGTVGRQYVLDIKSASDDILLPRFQYLCETTGKKLRYNSVDARGVLVWAHLQTGETWYSRKTFKSTFYTDQEIYRRALYLFNQRPKHLIVKTLGVTCYQLTPSSRSQISLLDEVNRGERLTQAVDNINDHFGNFIICAANSMPASRIVKQKIPFGSTKYFELLLKHG